MIAHVFVETMEKRLTPNVIAISFDLTMCLRNAEVRAQKQHLTNITTQTKIIT